MKNQLVQFDYNIDKIRIERQIFAQMFFKCPEADAMHEAPYGTIISLPGNEKILYEPWRKGVESVVRTLSAWTTVSEWSDENRRISIELPETRSSLQNLCEQLLDTLVMQSCGIAEAHASDPQDLINRLRANLM